MKILILLTMLIFPTYALADRWDLTLQAGRMLEIQEERDDIDTAIILGLQTNILTDHSGICIGALCDEKAFFAGIFYQLTTHSSAIIGASISKNDSFRTRYMIGLGINLVSYMTEFIIRMIARLDRLQYKLSKEGGKQEYENIE
jgi:hypothetical protein